MGVKNVSFVILQMCVASANLNSISGKIVDKKELRHDGELRNFVSEFELNISIGENLSSSGASNF